MLCISFASHSAKSDNNTFWFELISFLQSIIVIAETLGKMIDVGDSGVRNCEE